MILFPNCKINLGLNIIAKRSDGFHDVETVFYPLMIQDVVEVVQSNPQQTNQNDIQFSSSGLAIDGEEENNLCIKAYRLLQKHFALPAIQMHLHKNIPMGAGLGGGSADGAFTLQLLNQKFGLNIPQEQLIQYALQLGSDCPFFIINQPCFATSRGEVMSNVQLDLSAYQILIINPAIHINTGWAFSNITPQQPKKSIREIILQPISTWKNELVNDFEEPVSTQHPAISSIKKQLYASGALYACMTGTGSTVFGIFDKNTVPSLSFPSSYFTATV